MYRECCLDMTLSRKCGALSTQLSDPADVSKYCLEASTLVDCMLRKDYLCEAFQNFILDAELTHGATKM